MDTLDIFFKLENAFWCSTPNCNQFKKTLESIKWDDTFFADDEYYFIKGDLTFTTQSLDPFHMDWKPSGMFAGSCKSFEFSL